PTIAAMSPPAIAPQPARFDPPYSRAHLPAARISSTSAMVARVTSTTSVGMPMRSDWEKLYRSAAPTMTHRPGNPRGMRASPTSSAATSSIVSMLLPVCRDRFDRIRQQRGGLTDPYGGHAGGGVGRGVNPAKGRHARPAHRYGVPPRIGER